MHIEGDINEKKVLVIPITGNYRQFGKFNKTSQLNLIVYFTKSGEIRDSKISIYTPQLNNISKQLHGRNFYNITHKAADISDGHYRFLNISSSLQYELAYRNGKLFSESTLKNNTQSDQNMRSMAIVQECWDWYLNVKYYDEVGDLVNEESIYLTTTCEWKDTEAIDYIERDPWGQNIYYAYAKNYTRTWIVANLNGLGIYKTNTFTIEDNYFITYVGFGLVSKSANDPTNVIVGQTGAAAWFNSNFTQVLTTCTPKIYYPDSPGDTFVLPTGSADWTVPKIKTY